MERRPLGRSGIDVPVMCLGTMTFGEQNTKADGFRQMDIALDHGAGFFDTAELYAVPPKPETAGRTEEIIGDWMAERKNRDKVIIGTKVVGRTSGTYFRDHGDIAVLDRKNIHWAIDKSLQRLKTDHIDLYQIHWPDRNVSGFGNNPTRYSIPEPTPGEVPIEETLEALTELVTAGKVRALGISNESSWGVMRYLAAHEQKGLARIHSIQNAYNLVNRTFDTNLAEIAMRENVGLLAYSVLGQGYLTGKYLDGAKPPATRTTLFGRGQRYEKPGADAAIKACVQVAREAGLDPAQMALAFAVSRPFMTSVIIGATREAQLKNNLKAAEITLSKDVLERLDAIHQLTGNVAP